ncbi:zinc finger protein 431-like [Malaya genurostris]|uniref:zinc finger protein 431-like n=1 Tax=Malaya genurostris TaxID=325434 RepID=UPI0026F3ECED|nr:zinc finger protein 431-like [Malaya genurostris]
MDCKSESDDFFVCRLCLRSEVDELVSLYCTSYAQQQLVVDMIEDTLRLGASDKPHADDGMPQFVCGECVEKLNVACSFRKKCIRVNSLLRQAIFQEKTINDVEVCCRLCNETEADELISVFCIYAEKYQLIADIIVETIGIARPAHTDKLPQNICTKCFEQLSTISVFRELMISSDAQSKNVLPNFVKTEPIDSTGYVDNPLNLDTGDLVAVKQRKKTALGKSQQQHETQDPFIYLDAPELGSDSLRALFVTIEDEEYFEQLRFNGVVCCCGWLVENEEELKKHMKVSHMEKTKVRSHVKCNYCKMRFNYSTELNEHQENRNKKHYFRCKICNILTKERLALELHFEFTRFHPILDSSEGERLDFEDNVETIHTVDNRCCGCSNTFPDGESLFEHIREIHQGDLEEYPQFFCVMCHNSFSDKQLLMKHQLAYIGTRTYVCRETDCKYSTDQRPLMKKHIEVGVHQAPDGLRRIQNELEITEYFCCFRGCCEIKSTMSELKEHCQTVHGEQQLANSLFTDEPEKVCPLCKRHFPKEDSFDAHIKSHTQSRNNACSLCSSKFATRQKLRQHEKRVHSTDARVIHEFPCPQCESIYASKFTLTKHIARVHEQQSFSEICEICGKGYHSKSAKKQHMINAHVEDKPYKCHLCKLSFGSRPQLQKHLIIHTDDRPFACSYCSNTYRTPVDCKRHERAIHLNDKPFICEICAARFIRNRDLQLHMTVHTGNKLHCCNFDGCNFSTNIAKKLRDHYQDDHY